MRKAPECIHQRPGWPELTWDGEALAEALALVRFKQGRLVGRMETLGLELQTEASVAALTGEVVTSSAIEGEKLDEREVRSSIARRLGLDAAGMPKPSRKVEGFVEWSASSSGTTRRPPSIWCSGPAWRTSGS